MSKESISEYKENHDEGRIFNEGGEAKVKEVLIECFWCGDELKEHLLRTVCGNKVCYRCENSQDYKKYCIKQVKGLMHKNKLKNINK